MTRNPAGCRLWRTVDGGLVVDGDPAAVSLAYGPDDEVSGDDKALVPASKPAAAEPASATKKRTASHTAKPEE